MVKGMDKWSLNPFLDTLNIELKSPDLNFFLFADHLPTTLINQYESISDLKENSAQSWGHIEAFGDPISPKTSSQQPYSWSTMTWNTLYKRLLWDLFNKGEFIFTSYDLNVHLKNKENVIFFQREFFRDAGHGHGDTDAGGGRRDPWGGAIWLF